MKSNNAVSRRNFLILTAKGVIISAFLPSALLAATQASTLPGLIQQNINRFYSDPNAYIRQLKLFTDVYKKYSTTATAIREVECLRVQYPLFFCDILKDDLFAGRERKPVLGFMPQGAASFGYYLVEEGLTALLNEPKTTPENKALPRD